MTVLLENYSHATFPLEIQWRENGRVRLVAGFPTQGEHGRVVGYSYHVDRDGTEYFAQVLDWDGLGNFGSAGRFPDMDLPPPPAAVDVEVQRIAAQVAEIRDRLDAFPNAPDEWRARDERQIRELERKIKRLRPDLATAA